jgi:hypothetical protein
VFPKRSLLICLLSLVSIGVFEPRPIAAQDAAVNTKNQSGNWSAKNSNGLTLTGGWTAVPDSTGHIVTGTWTLVNPQGTTLASGAWSAAKAPTQWTGAWRAVIAGRSGEYSGTWTSSVDLKKDAPFAELFEKAVEVVVSGNWRSDKQSGPWSIRAAKRE